MTPEEAVVERLSTIAAVTALVGTRIYQLKVAQKSAYPAIRVQLISGQIPYHLRGPANMNPARVQVDAYAQETSGTNPYAGATVVADAIEGDWETGTPPNGLGGFRGQLGGSPPLIEVVILPIDRSVSYEAEELRLVRVRQDFVVWWKRI